MPRYFTTISYLNKPKNKLQENLQQFFTTNSNRIFNTDDEKLVFQNEIHQKNVQLNKAFSRCKPVEISSMKESNKRLYFFPGGHFIITQENTGHGQEE